jgi:glycosyltransferase involved in cell wall biosynthesis
MKAERAPGVPPFIDLEYETYRELGRKHFANARSRCAVITTSFNSKSTILRTILSVQAQPFPVRHVFIDGGSTDGTTELIRSAMRPSDILISERDQGISDAMNKGIAAANADTVCIIHSDDWLSENQLQIALDAMERAEADIVFGDVTFVVEEEPWYHEKGDAEYARSIHRRMPAIPHPSLLVKTRVYERVGLYRNDLRLAMDYDWILRAHRSGFKAHYTPDVVAYMTHDGASNNRFKETIKEVAAIVQDHGRPYWIAQLEKVGRTLKVRAGRFVRDIDPNLYLKLRRITNKQIADQV